MQPGRLAILAEMDDAEKMLTGAGKITKEIIDRRETPVREWWDIV